jgi:hypothetical protein
MAESRFKKRSPTHVAPDQNSLTHKPVLAEQEPEDLLVKYSDGMTWWHYKIHP